MGRYQKLLFALVLSYAPFSREQAFEITVSSLVHSFRDPSASQEGGLRTSLFKKVLERCRTSAPAGVAALSPSGSISPLDQMSLRIIHEALIGLSASDKEPLLLRDQAHLPMATVAAILDIGEPQARSHCLAARERLRDAVRSLLEKKSGGR